MSDILSFYNIIKPKSLIKGPERNDPMFTSFLK